jgi:mannosylglycerate hydrolase
VTQIPLSSTHPDDVESRSTAARPGVVAVVVPHTHWDREWYAPFETMRFHLLRFLDELIDTVEREPGLPAFLLDGQSVIVEDYLEVRRGARDRLTALVRAGRLRPGPFYVQPDELHVSGEAVVRNLLQGIAVAEGLGWVVREGYLPDTFGHVAQLPQILKGFGISTFYAMRGFGSDVEETGSELWWEAPDGSRVLVEWLTESYSNAAVLTPDPDTTWLHHGALVRYDRLPELVGRLQDRSRTGVLLLLNGGDHLRVQPGLPDMVSALDQQMDVEVVLGGLEEFHALTQHRPPPTTTVRGELRYGVRHDVFDGIGSTRTPLKALNDKLEGHLTGVAERLDAMAWLVDGRTSLDSLRYAWRELLKNHAHDSICGCSVDEVHTEMQTRYAKVGQVGQAVAHDALERLGRAVAASVTADDAVPVVVVNPSAHRRSGLVEVGVTPDLNAPLGERLFGWVQGPGVDWSDYALLDGAGRRLPFSVAHRAEAFVADPLDRRKELLRDRLTFLVDDAPALGAVQYRLVPGDQAAGAPDAPVPSGMSPVFRTERSLDNGVLHVAAAPDGTITVASHRFDRSLDGLLEILDDADAGDEYGAGPLPGDKPLSSRVLDWDVAPGPDPATLVLSATMHLPKGLTPDRQSRSTELVEQRLSITLALAPGSDRVGVTITVDNRAEDHRLRLRLPTGVLGGVTLADTAYGTIAREPTTPDGQGWRERPSGARALGRFVAASDDAGGLQVLTEGLHEYRCDETGVLDVTLLRCVGWMARTDHPLRPHKVGPQVPTPGAQCLGPQVMRLALRPIGPQEPLGLLHRAAEEVAVPLQAIAVQGRGGAGSDAAAADLGLSVGPEDVALTAVKVAEDGDGIIVRVVNTSAEAVVAELRSARPGLRPEACDLEERRVGPLDRDDAGCVRLSLRAGQIATVRWRVGTEGSAT